jgi:ribosome-associated heat shock protein Hsp15
MIKFGKIRVNGRKLTKVSSLIRVGDVITLTKNNEILVVRVLSWPVRRGSAKNLQDWYESI